jgi:hypothetical protein
LPSLLDVAAHSFFARETFHHLTLEVGQLSLLPRQQFLDIARAIVDEMVPADGVVVAEIGMVGGHRAGQRGTDRAQRYRLAVRRTADGARGMRLAPRGLEGFFGPRVVVHRAHSLPRKVE